MDYIFFIIKYILLVIVHGSYDGLFTNYQKWSEGQKKKKEKKILHKTIKIKRWR